MKLVHDVGGEAISVKVDVTSAEDTEMRAVATRDAFGRCNALINNAALYGGLAANPFTEIEEEEWGRCMSVNVKGIWMCCQALLPLMKESGGAIVNISSMAA